MHELLIT